MDKNVGNNPYYTDPLAAAWMEKHFDMRFKSEMNVEFSGYKYARLWLEDEINDDAKLYIHPYSLHLLEPHAGDLILLTKEFSVLVIDDPKKGIIAEATFPDGSEGIAELDELKSGKIIQRNGIPFMWPESEK